MDLKLLNQQSQSLQSLQHQSRSKSEARASVKIAQAYMLLERADQEGYNDKAKIRNAAALFTEALDLKTQDVRAHNGLAYIFTLLEEVEVGLQCVEAALEIEPNNIASLFFQAYLTHLDEGDAPPEDGSDLERLYEQTQSWLTEEIQNMSRETLPQPSLRVEQHELIKAKMEQIYDSYQQVLKRLDKLEAAFDVMHLRQLSQSLMTFFQRYKQIYRISKEMNHIHSQMGETSQDSKRLLHDTRTHAIWQHQLEENLEQLLDRCDEIADQLDTLDEQNIPLDDLLSAYNHLIAEVTAIQELIDELPRSEKIA